MVPTKIQCWMALMKEGLWTIVLKLHLLHPMRTGRHARFTARRDRALATIALSVKLSLLYLLGDLEDPTRCGKSWQISDVGQQARSTASAALVTTERR
jgi:hypothetical protein